MQALLRNDCAIGMEVLVSGATFAHFLKTLKEEPGDAVSCGQDTRCMDYI